MTNLITALLLSGIMLMPKGNGELLDVDVAYGTFNNNFQQGNKYMYRFESYDNDIVWCLEEKEIGFVPQEGASYALVFCQNGTTKENHECPEEYNCDCYTYDDIFLGVYRR